MEHAVARLARVTRIAGSLAAALLAASCVQLEWTRQIALEPVDVERLATLRAGASDLGECVATLGAPVYVWEYGGEGVALGYGSRRRSAFGISASVPIADRSSASFDYDQGTAQTRGWVLFFDADWKLVAIEQGRLRDLTLARERRRAASVEE